MFDAFFNSDPINGHYMTEKKNICVSFKTNRGLFFFATRKILKIELVLHVNLKSLKFMWPNQTSRGILGFSINHKTGFNQASKRALSELGT